MTVRGGMWKYTADCVECVQPEGGTKDMIRKVVVAGTRIPVNFEEEVRSLRNCDLFLRDLIVDGVQPGIQLV
jgi:hypothetical protein